MLVESTAYRLMAVQDLPRVLEPGRYVLSTSAGIVLGVRLMEPTTAADLAHRLDAGAVGLVQWSTRP